MKKINHSKAFRTRWFRQYRKKADSEVDVVAASDVHVRVPTPWKNQGKQGILWKKIPCREKSGNLENGENQGILQKHVREISGNFQLYIYNDSFPIFQDIYITWFHLT